MKRKLIISHVSALLMVMTVPVTVEAVNQVNYTVTYDKTLLVLGSDTLGGANYTTVSYKDLYNVGTPGMPSLPVDLITFSVPYNASNFMVSTSTTISETCLLDNPVYPLQSSGTGGITQPDISIYQGENPYPSQTAWVVDEGMMEGENHVVTVAILPWQYHHTTGSIIPDTLRMAESVAISLSYELTDSATLQALIRKGASLREEGYVRTCMRVVNPDDVRANAASAMNDKKEMPTPNDSVENPDTYLIITSPQLLNPMKRIAALKRQKGIRVKVVTVDEALTDSIGFYSYGYQDVNPTEPDSSWYYSGKLYNYILMHYINRGTKYVLLAGSDVPSRGGNDYYYSCLLKEWLYNYYPLITVGRLLGSTKEQMDNYTDKLYRYELNPGRGDASYVNDALLLESLYMATYDGNSVNILESMGMDVTMIHNFDPMLDYYGLEPFTGSKVVNLVNDNRYGFMSTLCNGAPNYVEVFEDYEECEDYEGFYKTASNYLWAIDSIKVAPNVIDTLEIGNGLNCFSNKDYPMIFFSAYGKTMPYKPVPGYGTGPCFGESFTTGKDYGGPAFIGYTDDIIEYLASTVFYRIFINNIRLYGYNLCDATLQTRTSLYDIDKDNISYLGDPALRMWTSSPQSYTDINIIRTDNGITVSGIPVDGTIIAYCDNDEQAGMVESSSSSVTINGVSPNGTIMLHKHNYLPLIAPLLIQNTTMNNSQYVIADVVKMGKAVDGNRTQGAVIIPDGVNYEIEASGKVTLEAGFKVERGAFFATHKSCYK